MNGYIKFWRKALDDPMIRNAELFRFWAWCLLKATHKPCSVMVGFQNVDLKPGQFVFGINKVADELATSPRKIRTCVDALIKSQNLTRKTTNKFSIITIVNWDAYQNETDQSGTQSDKQATSKRQASDNKQEWEECKETRIDPIGSIVGNVPFADAKVPTEPPCPHQQIIDLYHEILPGLPRIREWDDQAAAWLRSRWREKRERRTLDFWRQIFEYIKTCDFLMGRKTDFRADLRWIVRSSNFAKIVNGNYSNRDNSTHSKLVGVREKWLKKQTANGS